MGITSIITPILNKNFMNISHAFVYFGEEEIESQKGNTACPGSPSQQVEVLYLNPQNWMPEPKLLSTAIHDAALRFYARPNLQCGRRRQLGDDTHT